MSLSPRRPSGGLTRAWKARRRATRSNPHRPGLSDGEGARVVLPLFKVDLTRRIDRHIDYFGAGTAAGREGPGPRAPVHGRPGGGRDRPSPGRPGLRRAGRLRLVDGGGGTAASRPTVVVVLLALGGGGRRATPRKR